MSQFNLNHTTQKKDDNARQDINSRMNTFFNPHELQGNTNYRNDNLTGNNQQEISTDRRYFKNEINERINPFHRMDHLGQKQLPLNNNIRDYTATLDSKKEVFNDRLSNYNRLSSNINTPLSQINQNQNMSFHKNFKEESNQRLEQLSPLSRNLGMPFHGTTMPKKPDFGANIQDNFIDDKFTNYTYEEQFKKKEDSETERGNYIKNYEKLNQKMDGIPQVNYNSYDNFNYENYQSSGYVPPSNPNKIKMSHQKDIQGYDYSLMEGNKLKQTTPGKDDINNLPQLAVYNTLPVDTRQDYHFQNQLS